MGEVVTFARVPDEALSDRLAERHDASLEEEHRVSEQLQAIRQRFLAGDLVVQSGPRKGRPLTRKGRALLWERLAALMWRQMRLLDEQRRLYRQATGWSEHGG